MPVRAPCGPAVWAQHRTAAARETTRGFTPCDTWRARPQCLAGAPDRSGPAHQGRASIAQPPAPYDRASLGAHHPLARKVPWVLIASKLDGRLARKGFISRWGDHAGRETRGGPAARPFKGAVGQSRRTIFRVVVLQLAPRIEKVLKRLALFVIELTNRKLVGVVALVEVDQFLRVVILDWVISPSTAHGSAGLSALATTLGRLLFQPHIALPFQKKCAQTAGANHHFI